MADHAVHYVTDVEAGAVRSFVTTHAWPQGVSDERVFLPIEYADASGQAACRFCGEKIDKGERCIAFGFDSRNAAQTRMVRAYIHTDCEGATQ